MALILWLLALLLIVWGVVTLIGGNLALGIILIVVGLIIIPGYSALNR